MYQSVVKGDRKSRIWQWVVPTVSQRLPLVLLPLLMCAFLLTACANNPDFVALEQLPPHGGEDRSSSQRSASSSSASQPASSSASRPQPAPRPDRSSPPGNETPPDTYEVKSGDTLYSIAFRYGMDFRQLAQANDIDAPFTIVPGQQLDMRPDSPAQTASAPSGSAQRQQPSASSSPPTSSSGASSGQNTATAPAPGSSASGSVDGWTWPVEGTIVRPFSNGVSGSRGIDIDAPLGESVRAAADGKVVYAGDGLRGYGNLIILEHAGRMLSAYAFTEDISVSEQQEVKRGDVIAAVGARGDTPLLHFEIRDEGKPVDPTRFLPQR